MRPARSLIAALAAATVLLASCTSDGDDGAGSTTTTPVGEASTTTATQDAVELLDTTPLDTTSLGPYTVGRRTVTITDPDRDDRMLTTDIWYPTDATDGDPSVYSFAPGIEYDSEVALDAPPVSGEGPFPLVVYSHGSGGLRYVSSFLTETLASHGVVVVAPDHAGNTTLDSIAGTEADRETNLRDRPLDISLVIDAMHLGSADLEVTKAIDGGPIGVIGHSFGAYTTLAMAGGVSALDIAADDRVSAIVPLAPAAGVLDDEDLAAIDVPTMVISGTLDTSTPIDPNTERVAELVSGPVVRVDLEGATHQSFSDVCDYTVLLRELEVDVSLIAFVDEFAGTTCDPNVLEVEEAHGLINRYAIAFLLAELTSSTEAQATLDEPAPEAVSFTVFDR